jgi:hypothetical protein
MLGVGLVSHSDLSAIGSGVMTDVAGRDGIAGRQSHLRQVSRIARVFRCKHFHQSLRIHRIRQSSDICAVKKKKKKKICLTCTKVPLVMINL